MRVLGAFTRRQRGAALLVLLSLVALIVTATLANRLRHASGPYSDDDRTAQALAQAREALVGFALNPPVGVLPGRLPCPDTDNDGWANNTLAICGNTAISRLGRLPWKTLNLPDLRDADGECLWYAVSGRFKETLTVPATVVVNSDTNGQFSVRGDDGVTYLAGLATDTLAAAIVFAPGRALAGQTRAGGAGTRCGGNATANNYLDNTGGINNAVVAGGINATTAATAAAPSATFNDRLMVLSPAQVLSAVERRVVREARNCLSAYAATAGGRYPWAAQLNTSAPPEYGGDVGSNFGRIPTAPSGAGMPLAWPVTVPACVFLSPYWNNWRALVFYHVAPGYAPGSTPSCGTCLTVNTTINVRAVVALAGRRLAAPPPARISNTEQGTATNYLEGTNATPADNTYTSQAPTATANDLVQCLATGNCP